MIVKDVWRCFMMASGELSAMITSVTMRYAVTVSAAYLQSNGARSV